MNRRSFLQSLIATGLAATIDVDRLLWTPGQRTVFIPRWTESQRAQWLAFCHNRDQWLKWFENPTDAESWPPEFKADIYRKIVLGNARAKELGLDERLHRTVTAQEEIAPVVYLVE